MSGLRSVSVFVSAVLLCLGVVTGFLAGWFLGDGSVHDWVLIYAGAAELFGVLLIASPELVPLLRRGGVALAKGWQAAMLGRRQLANRLRRVFGRPRNQQVVLGAASASASGHGGAEATVVVGPGKTLDEKVEFLLRREGEMRDKLRGITGEIERLPAQWRVEIEATASDLQDGFTTEIRDLDERHIRARVLGIALVPIGILLNTWGNLI